MRKKIRLTLLFRSNSGGHSIENVYEKIADSIQDDFEVVIKYLPSSGLNIFSVLKNLWFVSKLEGLIHITGDIHYVSIFPWKKIVLTIHDVGSILSGNSLTKRFLKKLFWIWIPVTLSKRITVVSIFTKKELLNLTPWVTNKLAVIHNPKTNLLVFNESVKEFDYILPKILLIGTKQNKNIERTFQSLTGINCELWIIGELTNKQISLLRDLNILYVNYTNVSNSQLGQLYAECDIVSFISLYEGFGLPVVESQTYGKVLITSRIEPLLDIAGDGAVFVNPLDVHDMRIGFTNIISDASLRLKCIENGYKNIERFKLDLIVSEYKKIYFELAN